MKFGLALDHDFYMSEVVAGIYIDSTFGEAVGLCQDISFCEWE